tara:strand:- start:2506 stop:4608 length:2103 start_codon:yes stop_codon:yes gene_type:complete
MKMDKTSNNISVELTDSKNFKIKQQMNTKINLNRESHPMWALSHLMKFVLISTFILIGFQSPIAAQEAQYETPSWRFGLAGAANANYYQGTTQQLTSSLFTLQPFGHGNGVGLFLAPSIEYHNPESVFGFMLQAGLDSRRGTFDGVTSPCNCPLDLSTELSYITIEPSIRVAPFRSNFYLYAGPRFAFGRDKSFEYNKGVNPDFPNSSDPMDVNDDFSEMEKTQLSMQIGTGIDIPINSTSSRTQYMISPFITYHPYFGQTPRSIETWNNTTIRAGVAIKFGRGKRIDLPAPAPIVAAPLPAVNFTVNSPVNAPAERIFIESFPIRNYLFFNQESTTIPNRYILINRSQASDFNDNQLAGLNESPFAARSVRQMTVYYNILNILGDRMVKNPTSTITLVGSSVGGAQDATMRAESVKTYLVDIFGINASRITTEGRISPNLPSLKRQSGDQLALLRQEDSRVTIESRSASLLRAYRTGPDMSQPITSSSAQVAPSDSYVTFNVGNAYRNFASWSLEVEDEDGNTQNFGPYTDASVSLPGATILGNRSNGRYQVTMIGETTDGRTVRKESTVEVVRWEPDTLEVGSRYSVIYEFDSSTASSVEERFLTDVVAPSIPEGATVRIHGFTDTIGEADHNMQLSQARASNARSIIVRALAGTNRTDVRFESEGFGKNSTRSPFGNTHPEERFYNRTVLIEIIPAN